MRRFQVRVLTGVQIKYNGKGSSIHLQVQESAAQRRPREDKVIKEQVVKELL